MNELKQSSILIIDDNPVNLKLLGELLSNSGFRVRIANSAVLGMQSVRSVQPDLILLDISMPEMDGYTVCEELKKDPLTKHIPVIFISASYGGLNTIKAFEVGGIDYINKPFDAAEVLVRIKNHLELSLLQRQTQQSLATSQHMLEAIMNYSPAVIFIKDLEGRHILVNREFERVLLATHAEVVGKTAYELFSKDNAEIMRHSDEEIIECGHHKQFEEKVDINGETHVYLSLKFPLWDAYGNIYAIGGISTDITSRKLAEAELEQLATRDTLTKLPNRSLMMALLSQTLATSERKNVRDAVLFFDLDDFKNVNDSLGHHVGDLLLKEVAKRLLECTRKQDTVSRMGGDEFIILLQGIKNNAEAAEVAKKVLVRMEEPFDVDHKRVFVSASIGIVISPDNGRDVKTLLRHADTAMYNAKAKGRKTFEFFTDEMNARVRQRMETEKELRVALDEDTIRAFYQPIIDVKTGKIQGVEALARWHHPIKGDISPTIFIPIAEESGLILPIDRHVLYTAVMQFAPLIKQGLFYGSVSVNLSADHFRNTDILDYIDRLLEQFDFPAKHLCLELTEGNLIENFNGAVKLMSQMRERGIQLSIDDFGTGYSSLSYLKQFPVHSLKIDISFIRSMNNSQRDKRLVESIIGLGHGLDLECVAEGVESIEQVTALQEINCDRLQGFLFSEAIEFEKLRALLSAKTPFGIFNS